MTKTVKSPVSHEFGMNNPASSEATGPPVGGPPNGPNLNNSLGKIFWHFLSNLLIQKTDCLLNSSALFLRHFYVIFAIFIKDLNSFWWEDHF